MIVAISVVDKSKQVKNVYGSSHVGTYFAEIPYEPSDFSKVSVFAVNSPTEEQDNVCKTVAGKLLSKEEIAEVFGGVYNQYGEDVTHKLTNSSEVKTPGIPEDFPKYEDQTEEERQKEFEAFTKLQNNFNLTTTGTYAEQKKAIELTMLRDAVALDVELQTPESLSYLANVIMEIQPAYRPLIELIQKKLATLKSTFASPTTV